MFWKKKKSEAKQESKIILGMVMIRDDNSFNLDSFKSDYKRYAKIEDTAGDNSSFAFSVSGEDIAIVHMPFPIPSGDIEGTAQYAYNWNTVLEDTKDHKSHLLVSVINGGEDQIKRFKIFTQILCSLLRTTNSIGVYKGNQSLLIPKIDYLNEADFMTDDYLPLNLWIYFGLRAGEHDNSGYTYGLKAFNKREMEVLNSTKSVEDIRAFLFNMSHYILDCDIEFQDGQTCGLSEDERIEITFSKGKFVEGETFKLAY